MDKVFHKGGRKSERIFTLVEENLQQKYMHEAGFFDITVKDIKCPFGAWSQDKKQKESAYLPASRSRRILRVRLPPVRGLLWCTC